MVFPLFIPPVHKTGNRISLSDDMIEKKRREGNVCLLLLTLITVLPRLTHYDRHVVSTITNARCVIQVFSHHCTAYDRLIGRRRWWDILVPGDVQKHFDAFWDLECLGS